MRNAVLADDEGRRDVAEVLHLEAHAGAGLGKRDAFADHAFAFNHVRGDIGDAPERVARAQAGFRMGAVRDGERFDARRAPSRGREVSPIMMVSCSGTSSSAMSSWSIAGAASAGSRRRSARLRGFKPWKSRS